MHDDRSLSHNTLSRVTWRHDNSPELPDVMTLSPALPDIISGSWRQVALDRVSWRQVTLESVLWDQLRSLWMLVSPGRGVLTIYAVSQVCQHQECDFDKKMQEKGCVLGQRMNYSTTIPESFRGYAPFVSSFVQRRYFLAKFASPPKNARERVSFLHISQEKGYGFGSRVGTTTHKS